VVGELLNGGGEVIPGVAGGVVGHEHGGGIGREIVLAPGSAVDAAAEIDGAPADGGEDQAAVRDLAAGLAPSLREGVLEGVLEDVLGIRFGPGELPGVEEKAFGVGIQPALPPAFRWRGWVGVPLHIP
jgi:hypothetical protein